MAISIGLATTSGLALIGISSAQGTPVLTTEEINQGLVFPAVAQVSVQKGLGESDVETFIPNCTYF